jgi:hypothetical protein
MYAFENIPRHQDEVIRHVYEELYYKQFYRGKYHRINACDYIATYKVLQNKGLMHFSGIFDQ